MFQRKKKIEYASAEQVAQRSREVALLVNVVEPDPEYQAFFISDEASLLDVCGVDPSLVKARLEAYFCTSLPDEILRTPLPELVNRLKGKFSSWPDDWPPTPN